MMFTRISPISGIMHSMDIPVTEDEFNLWESGILIQHAMPNITPAQREFILTGITEEEWEEEFKDDVEDPPEDFS